MTQRPDDPLTGLRDAAAVLAAYGRGHPAQIAANTVSALTALRAARTRADLSRAQHDEVTAAWAWWVEEPCRARGRHDNDGTGWCPTCALPAHAPTR